jgi:LmbE family N-acetylglucosaminyl deacetylase
VPPPPFSLKKQQTDYVERAYGFNKVFWMKYPAAHLDTISMQEIVSKIADIFKQTIPEVVYVPSRTDIHSDHRVVFDAVFACTKRFRYLSVKKVLMYETVSETEQAPALMDRAFIPNYYVDITKFFKQKMDIMKNAYHMELERPPFPRSVKNVEALATFRGSTMGIKFAEAFHLLKWIV